jgi:hypothetical protein
MSGVTDPVGEREETVISQASVKSRPSVEVLALFR